MSKLYITRSVSSEEKKKIFLFLSKFCNVNFKNCKKKDRTIYCRLYRSINIFLYFMVGNAVHNMYFYILLLNRPQP
jgi:hypothetical protein